MTTKKMDDDTDVDPKVVRDILDKLKSEGLFDQFRKECLADVDTKPAFQNLRQRVEGYVSRFLMRQMWSPHLNKNHLRDNLRRQINQSGMLATGVERVIEQVVNPKIFSVIKPKIDEIACLHLGIDPEKRKERLEWKKIQQKENLQSLMSLSVPPPDFQQQQQQQPQLVQQQPAPLLQPITPFASPPLMAGFPQTFGSWQSPQTPQTPQQPSMMAAYPQGYMSFPMAMPFPLPYGMPPQAFPYMPNPWGGFTMPNIYTQPPGFGTPTSVGSDISSANPPIPGSSVNPPIPGMLSQFGLSPTPSVVQNTLTVASTSHNTSVTDTPTPPRTNLPPLPPIPKTPPPPGTEEVPVMPKVPPKQEASKALFTEEKNILEDIPLPAMPPTPKKKEEKIASQLGSESVVSDMKSTSGDDSSQDVSMIITDNESEDIHLAYKTGEVDSSQDIVMEDGETKRPYKFAWNRKEDEMSDISEMSVSSVHTSDLSLFSEGGFDIEAQSSDLSDDDIPAPCYSPHRGEEDSDLEPPEVTEAEEVAVAVPDEDKDITSVNPEEKLNAKLATLDLEKPNFSDLDAAEPVSSEIEKSDVPDIAKQDLPDVGKEDLPELEKQDASEIEKPLMPDIEKPVSPDSKETLETEELLPVETMEVATISESATEVAELPVLPSVTEPLVSVEKKEEEVTSPIKAPTTPSPSESPVKVQNLSSTSPDETPSKPRQLVLAISPGESPSKSPHVSSTLSPGVTPGKPRQIVFTVSPGVSPKKPPQLLSTVSPAETSNKPQQLVLTVSPGVSPNKPPQLLSTVSPAETPSKPQQLVLTVSPGDSAGKLQHLSSSTSPGTSPVKPRRLISLQYNYSDSEDEETREERKARIAREKEERYVQRLQRRAELEARRKDREEEKAKLREERKKSKENRKEEEMDKDTQDVSKKEETEGQEETPVKCPDSPEKRKKKTKAELKEELTKQKVQEKKEALRRQRTRNRRYTSDEFTSIYTEKKQPFSSQSYGEVVMVEEEVTVEETVETDFTVAMMVDIAPDPVSEDVQQEEEVVMETITDVHEDSFESPATPTQDEIANENQVELTQDVTSIPIYETLNTSVGQIIHQTRSHRKISDDICSNSSGRAASPTSDTSDAVKDDVAGEGRRKRKRRDSGQARSTEPEKQSSKRYDTSDLYKPHRTFPSTRRQGSSPGAASTVTTATTPSSDDGNKVRSSLDDTSPISSRSTSPSSLIRQTSPISSSSASFSSRSHKSRSRSNSSSSTGSHHSRGSGRKSVSGTSSSSVDEFGRRKRKNLKMPIYMVDFGEAARQAKTSLIDVNFGEAERWVQQQGSRPFRSRGGIQTRAGPPTRGANPVGRGGRGQWIGGQGNWPFATGRPPGGASPPQSPQKHFYGHVSMERSISPDMPQPGSPSHSWQSTSPPHHRGLRPESPPYPYPRGREITPPPTHVYSRSRSPGYRSGSPGYRSGSPGYRSGSPGYRRTSVESPLHYSQSSFSPPPMRPVTRGQRSPSPPMRPITRGQRPLSPDDCIEMISSSSGSFDDACPSPPPRQTQRSQRPPSPPTGSSDPPSPSPPLRTRAQRPTSPTSPVTRGPKSPSPPHPAIRLQRPPSPSSPPSRPLTRGRRSPSPSHLRGPRPPSPPSRPLTRGQITPSPPISPPPGKRTRPPSPPTRPFTRGQRATSPPYPMEEAVPSTRELRSQRPPSPPMMSQRLRVKHTAPDRFSPPPIQREGRRQRPPSPPLARFNPAKKAKRGT